MGVYRTIFRFAGSGTMLAIARAILLYFIPFSIICMIYTLPDVPRTIGILQPIIFFLLLVISRIIVRYFLTDIMRVHGFRGDVRKILIYGGGSSGRQLASSLKQEPGFQIIGFIDDDRRLDGNLLDSIKVYHAAKIERLINLHGVTDIILAMPRNSKLKNRQIVERLEPFNLRVKTVPAIGDLVNGTITAEVVRDINVVDLLGRDPVPPDELLLSKAIFQKTVMVTGAGGSIGSELCKQIMLRRPSRLVLVEMAEYALYRIEQDLTLMARDMPEGAAIDIVPELVNISEQVVVDRLFQRWMPDTVLHAAAYKHVPLVEHNPIGGMRNNIFGTYYCAKAAERCSVANFILVSTDKAVRPTNVMGATKRVCELILQALAQAGSTTKFVMVRFGNVLGSSGSVVPLFEKQIREGGPVTLTDRRITRYFMTIPEAAQLVIQAGAIAQPGEVCVLDMGPSVKIIDLAKTMIRLSGLTLKEVNNPDGDIEIIEVGLRPGEKLYEELLIGENPEPTIHKKIFKAKEDFLPKDEIEPQLIAMRQHLLEGNAIESVALLKKLVPEFRSSADAL
ncbi:MAG: capsule biosynthesis protein CapD [Erythrobacter sp.]|nr:capsule biosynthesis protein CapD [Erythrobacter sp.]